MFGKKAETEVVEEVERELKFKEWFNLKGIRAEIKNVHWLTKKELFNNSLTVLVFTFVMGLWNTEYEQTEKRKAAAGAGQAAGIRRRA